MTDDSSGDQVISSYVPKSQRGLRYFLRIPGQITDMIEDLDDVGTAKMVLTSQSLTIDYGRAEGPLPLPLSEIQSIELHRRVFWTLTAIGAIGLVLGIIISFGGGPSGPPILVLGLGVVYASSLLYVVRVKRTAARDIAFEFSGREVEVWFVGRDRNLSSFVGEVAARLGTGNEPSSSPEALTSASGSAVMPTPAPSSPGEEAYGGSPQANWRHRGISVGLVGSHGFSAVTSIALTPDARVAVSGGNDKTVRVWDLAILGRERRDLRGHRRAVTAVAITPDGRVAVSGSKDKTVRVWDLATGAQLHTLEGHTYAVTAVAVTADDRVAVSGSSDKTVRVWDLATGAQLCILDSRFHFLKEAVTAVALTPDGRVVISGSKESKVHMFTPSGWK